MARFIAAFLLLFIVDVNAQDFRSDSRVTWTDKSKIRTITGETQAAWGTLRYEVHAHPRDEVYVKQLQQIMRDDAPKVMDYFEYVPKDTLHFVINDDDTLANGSATVFPRNLIVLNTYPPIGDEFLNSGEDFIRALVLHELVHILHMDQTAGVLGVTRAIFGSIGKLGGVVPRWFAEGVATWAESEFTDGGRLKSKRLDYATRYYFGQANTCRSVDCLDEPGILPNGSLAYWAGAKFLTWLEDKSAGTIRCLIQKNSSRLPFFLDSVFKRCTEDSVATLFERFINEYAPLTSEAGFWPRGQQRVNFQKGFVLKGDEFVFVTKEEDRERIVFKHLESKQERSLRFPIKIHQLHSVTKDGHIILSGMRHRPSETVREWWQIDGNTLELSKLTIPSGVSVDYIVGDYSFRREDHRYEIWQGDTLVKPLAELNDIKATGEVDGELWWHSGFEVATLNKVLFKYNRPFEVVSTCNKDFLIATHNGLVLVNENGAQNIENPNRLVQVRTNDRWQVVISSDDLLGPSITPGDCSILFAGLKKGGDFEQVEKEIASFDESNSESFPSLRHFTPNYWILGFETGDNVTSWIASTTLSDPLDRHVFFLNANWYPSISKTTPHVSYTYDFNSYLFALEHKRIYTDSGLNNDVDEDTQTTFSISKQFNFGAWVSLPGLYRSWRETTDFISSRNTIDTGVRFSLARLPETDDQLLQLTTLGGRFFQSETRDFEHYWGGQVRLAQSLRLTSATQFHSHYTYGRLAKNGFGSGVLYAGGSNDMYSSNFHEFYGLDRNGAFGNTVQTARAQVEQEVWRIFRSKDLLPLYFKSMHLLAGADWLQTDRTFIDGRFLRDKDIFSYHAGVKLRTDIAYLLPLDMELIYTQLKNPIGEDHTGWLFLLKGSIFP